MKSKKRWSWLFGDEPPRPVKKKRRPASHRLNGHSDDRFDNRIPPRRSVDKAIRSRVNSSNQPNSEPRGETPRVPKRLRLEGEHDFHVVNDATGGSMVLKACRMRGFSEFLPNETGSETTPDAAAKWLVLEHPDGHLSYIPSDRVWYIEETSKATE
ncbi:MAG: hypothetical protein LW870_25345 [Pirellula sp.]|jgi:hypothetical protein|nr:hypothetical protein [Pirellula sp.]